MFPQELTAVLARLEQAGHEAYAVGGCVRDLLLGISPGDWDITTSALPQETMALFEGYSIPTGLQHGTVTVVWEGQSFEVTTFRCDGDYADHRHPDAVRFTRSLTEDLRRRDFTVNAMAMDRQGRLTDPCGGQADLRRRLLRCVGDADTRMEEDALRILRGLRFAATPGFAIDGETDRAIRSHRQGLGQISAERIRVELQKLLCGANAAEVLRAYPEVVGVVLPELAPMVGLDQRNCHHCYDLWEHTLHAVAAVPAESVLRWTMLLHDVGKPACFTVDAQGVGHFYGHPQTGAMLAEEICRRLRFDKKTAGRIIQLIAWHDRDIPRTRRGIARAIRELGEEAFWQLCAVKRADNLAQSAEFRWVQQEIAAAEDIARTVLAEKSCLTREQLAVNGRDLLSLGLRGRAIGETLERLLSQVIDGTLPNERQALLAACHSEEGR